jgi:hypothetical protein
MKTAIIVFRMVIESLWENVKHLFWTSDRCVDVVAERWKKRIEEGHE